MTADASTVPLRSLYVIVHTHWDREWYHPAIRFRARLVALVDALLARDEALARPFLLDGQAVVLADYLEVRPDAAPRLRAALERGAIEAGPWFVLADNLIPSGEALVRNLAAGARWMSRVGGRAPQVAYCPDTFGHPAALPMIAAGFGFSAAVVWRGFGGAGHPRADTFAWSAPDGSTICAFHLPPDGYEFGSGLPNETSAMRERWAHVKAVLSARSHTGISALTVGADHHAPPPDVDARVASLGTVANASSTHALSVQRTSLSAFGAALAALDARALPHVYGELRDSYGYTWTLQGTFATRAHQKRANARLERRLIWECEPLAALAWLHGDASSREVSPAGVISQAQLPALLNHAWETLLRTHPHDTLCGCSIDAVADAMTMRQRDVLALSSELRSAALDIALQHDPVHARSLPVDDASLLVVYNGSARARGGVATIVLREKVCDVPVGPASGATSAQSTQALSDIVGAGAGVQQLGPSRMVYRRRESPQHYPDNDLVRERVALVWIPPVPAFGVRVLDLSAAAVESAPESAPVPLRASTRRDRDGLTTTRIENEHAAIEVNTRGATIRVGARTIENALRLETVADEGDTYTPSLRGEPDVLRIVDVRALAKGPLRASVRIRWRWTNADRSQRIMVDTVLSLDAGSAIVRGAVRGVNKRRQQRLQLIWRTDVKSPSISAQGASDDVARGDYRVMADAAFGPVDRSRRPSTPRATADAPFEQPPETMPLHRWLAISDGMRGAALISDGLAEGSARHGELAVTLVRSVGELSVNSAPERPGHAGWPVPTPLAQCIGPFRATVGLLLHETWSDATLLDIERASDSLLLSLRGASHANLDRGEHRGTRTVSGPSLDGDGLVASAVRVSDDGEYLVLRCVNITSQRVTGAWQLPASGPWRARDARLDDAPLGEWERVHDARVPLSVPARAVHTVHVRREVAADRA